jgi:hypothetical protein
MNTRMSKDTSNSKNALNSRKASKDRQLQHVRKEQQKRQQHHWLPRNVTSQQNITAPTAEGRPITTRMPEIDLSTTVLASAGTPTAQYGHQQHNMDANNS